VIFVLAASPANTYLFELANLIKEWCEVRDESDLILVFGYQERTVYDCLQYVSHFIPFIAYFAYFAYLDLSFTLQ
jgi:hypothetical protein